MLIFFLSLIIIIILHELGHFIVTQKVGGKVEVISIGFGRAIYKKTINGVVCQITPWLLGGYCKLKGELEISNDKESFSNLPYLKKVAIAIAGCAINILLGMLCFFIGIKLNIFNLYYFGLLSFLLGVTNLIPIPCLDGGYVIWLPILTKIFGHKKGFCYFAIINKISFILIIILNILCIPFIIMNWRNL